MYKIKRTQVFILGVKAPRFWDNYGHFTDRGQKKFACGSATIRNMCKQNNISKSLYAKINVGDYIPISFNYVTYKYKDNYYSKIKNITIITNDN